MKHKWDIDDERLARYLRISGIKKLEWLQEMHDLLLFTATPAKKEIFWKLRGIK